MEKIDIVLQGAYSDYVLETAQHYKKLEFVNNIIISCWEDSEFPTEDPSIKVVCSVVPEDVGTENRNLQIISSLNGIKNCSSEFVVKMRNDQRYTLEAMEVMYNFYIDNRNREITWWNYDSKPYYKIAVAGIFPGLLFHPRDHIFWGHKQDLLDLFNIPLDRFHLEDHITFTNPGLGPIRYQYSWYYSYYVRAETYLGMHYLSNFYPDIKHMIMKKDQYLFDNAPNWDEAKQISDVYTSKVFLPFPKEGVDLEWPKNNWTTYPYDQQKSQYGECWYKDLK